MVAMQMISKNTHVSRFYSQRSAVWRVTTTYAPQEDGGCVFGRYLQPIDVNVGHFTSLKDRSMSLSTHLYYPHTTNFGLGNCLFIQAWEARLNEVRWEIYCNCRFEIWQPKQIYFYLILMCINIHSPLSITSVI